MEKYYHSYNISYEKFTPDWFEVDNQKVIDRFLNENSESMITFIESYFKQFNISKDSLRGKEILITGCGFGGLCHYFSKLGAEVTGLDVSPLAIVGAKEIAKNKNLLVHFVTIDVCKESLEKKFDYIFDDHLLHCLTTASDRSAYLNFAHKHLNDDGLFLTETITFQNTFQTPIDYYLDEDFILWKQSGENASDTMIRKIAMSIDIENEVISSGLKINYLYYHAELAFQVFPDYPDYPFKYLPRTLRFSAKR